jgi:Holliday junction resolvase RusA-like endonuclease
LSIPSFEDRPFGCPLDEIDPVTVTLAGHPQGKGRARSFMYTSKKTGKLTVGHHTPGKTATYEGMIRTAAMEAMGNRPPLAEPVEFVLRAIFQVPASWSRKKHADALCGLLKPAKKPDLDNLTKAWSDALNGVVYQDDAQIVRMTLEKRYGSAPLVVVTVRAAP